MPVSRAASRSTARVIAAAMLVVVLAGNALASDFDDAIGDAGDVSITSGAYVSLLTMFQEQAFAVAVDEKNEPVIACTTAGAAGGRGRACGFGHPIFLGDDYLDSDGDETEWGSKNKQLLSNLRDWVLPQGAGATPKVAFFDSGDAIKNVERELPGAEVTKLTRSAIDAAEDLSNFDLIYAYGHSLWGSGGDAVTARVDKFVDFVKGGGGLLMSGMGWVWLSYGPNQPLHQFPANLILQNFGLAWVGDGHRGAASIPSVPQHELNGALALKRLNDGSADEPADVAKYMDTVGTTMERLSSAVSPVPAPFLEEVVTMHGKMCTFSDEGGYFPTDSNRISPSDLLRRGCVKLVHGVHTALPGPGDADLLDIGDAYRDFPGAPGSGERVYEKLALTVNVGRYGWQPLEAWAVAGRTFSLKVMDAALLEHGLEYKVGAHSDTLWGKDKEAWRRWPDISVTGKLRTAETQVRARWGGLAYVWVSKEAFEAGLRQVEVEVGNVVKPIFFHFNETRVADWPAIRQRDVPFGHLVLENIVHTLPKSALQDPIVNIEKVVAWWNEVMVHTFTLKGEPIETWRKQQFVFDRQISAGYFHSGYPIMGHVPQGIEQIRITPVDGHWGPYHEMGHNLQHGDWTFDGTTEVTCNLWSLYLQEKMGEVPRSMRPDEDKAVRYRLQNESFDDRWKKSPFLALQFYRLLQIAFGWQSFTDMFAVYRGLVAADRPSGDQEEMDQFMVRYSKVVGRNLGPYFTDWHFPLTAGALENAEVKALPVWRPAPYARARLRKAGHDTANKDDKYWKDGSWIAPADELRTAARVGASSEVRMELHNVGDAQLTVTRVTFTDYRFRLAEPATLPFSVAPLEHVTVVVAFTPTASGASGSRAFNAGEMSVESDDPDGAYRVRLRGQADACPDGQCMEAVSDRGLHLEGDAGTLIPRAGHAPRVSDGTVFDDYLFGRDSGAVVQDFTLVNHLAGPKSVTIEAVDVTNSRGAGFDLAGSLPTRNIPLNRADQFSLKFEPAAYGLHLAAVLVKAVDADGGRHEWSFRVAGTGVACSDAPGTACEPDEEGNSGGSCWGENDEKNCAKTCGVCTIDPDVLIDDLGDGGNGGNGNDDSGGLGAGALAGIVVGAVVVVALGAAVYWKASRNGGGQKQQASAHELI